MGSPPLMRRSKHILNAQVAIRAPCCESTEPPRPVTPAHVLTTPGRKWFDCAECHHEVSDHDLMQSFEMTFVCKKCKKAFRKDSREFEDSSVFSCSRKTVSAC